LQKKIKIFGEMKLLFTFATNSYRKIIFFSIMQIQEIKQKLSILRVLQHYNLQADKNNMLNCPFHEDKTPSMKVYESTGTFHCFGCGAGGDQIEFIEKREKLNKHQAIQKAEFMIPGHQEAQQPESRKSKENHTVILTKIFETFKKGLQSPVSKKPKEYLQSRHLDYKKTEIPVLSAVEIGYNSGQFHHRGKLSEPDKKACISAGLLVPYKGKVPNAGEKTYTAFAGSCIIFPLKNSKNEIVSLYGRSILNTNKSKHYYLKNTTGLYPKYPEPETEILILTESIIDAATLQFSVHSLQSAVGSLSLLVLACYGTNGMKAEHIKAIKELQNLKEIIFFFDGDKAGENAAEKYAEELKKFTTSKLLKFKISKVETPENEDVNSLLDGHKPEIFTHLINDRREFSFLTEKSEISKTPISTSSISGNEKNGEAGKELKANRQQPKSQQLNTTNPDYITFTKGDIGISVLGGINMQQLDRLQVTLKIAFELNSVRNSINLYNIDQTDRFIQKAAEKLETGTSLLNQSISELTDKLESYRINKIEAMKTTKQKRRELTQEREKAAINYLSKKDLLKRTNRDIGKSGIVGEDTNRLLMYLIFTSRLREQPLHIISLGSSGTGKTYLQEKISELIPEHDKKIITILSDNAFYYFERKELCHKLVLIEDMDGAEAVMYALRELMTKKMISKSVTAKDSKGNNKTVNVIVEGPICLAGTTTKERLYEDNANRSILIYLDNSAEQKERIMDYQRTESAGQISKQKEDEIKDFFKDMQTVLKPVKVVNPYAKELKIPDYVFKPLRTNSHYLTFIETVTFYHQYQRELKTNPETGGAGLPEKYIETTIEDIENANKLIKNVLLAKSDELTKAVRDFFERVKHWLITNNKSSFFAKEIREEFRMSPTSCNRYILELLRNNYIRISGGNKYSRGYEYEVLKSEEYEKLKSKISNVLDEVLQKLKTSVSR
jgi:DNA primase catalytic core